MSRKWSWYEKMYDKFVTLSVGWTNAHVEMHTLREQDREWCIQYLNWLFRIGNEKSAKRTKFKHYLDIGVPSVCVWNTGRLSSIAHGVNFAYYKRWKFLPLHSSIFRVSVTFMRTIAFLQFPCRQYFHTEYLHSFTFYNNVASECVKAESLGWNFSELRKHPDTRHQLGDCTIT